MANDDAYSVDKGATLDVVAPGVLDNDSDADGNPLTAIKVSDPIHGSLTLNADGSFSYTHDGSESASDNFTYQANDGFEDSNIATVNITTNGEAIIIDHNCTEITQIPEWAIVLAKNNLHIGYGHTSHGSQITDGMMGLVDFANSGGKELSLPEDIFAWNNGGTDGALDLEEGSGYSAGWLAGDCGSYGQWEIETREYLDDPSHSDVNVIIWSWCGQVDNKYASGTLDREYLTPMTQLEADYPDVTFVYMTGHVDHWDDANNKAANQMIRDFCIANGKVLYDFADIESYDPDGTCFEFPDDNCNYYNSADNTTSLGNWAMEWQDSHTQDVDWYNCSAAHTEPLNANQKAYAAWWLWARLGGWDATSTNQPPVLTTIGDKYVNEGQLLEFTVSATDPDEDDLTYSVSNLPPGANFTSSTGNFSWTPTEDQSGIYPNICFVVSDGTLTDSECISITVHDVHYVSISGNDNNTGTLSQPWRTITYAASQVQPGDTVYVRGGTYNEQVIIDSDGNADNWITFINYLGETPIIDGSFLDLSLDGLVRIGDANYIVFDGFYVTNSDNFGVYIFQCDHIIVQNSTTNNSGLFCIGVNESSEVWLTNITNDG